jgi:YD repeat-containing protein
LEWEGPEEVKTAEFFDREGRLFVIQEPNGTRTRYHYDVAGRLISVAQNVGQAIRQQRKFRYDGRGFLMWETHPESGLANYWYDAKGNVIRSNKAGTNVNFSYDAAGRLTKAHNARTEVVLKEYFYGPSDASKGRLTDEWAYNWRPPGSPAVCTNFKVGESYTYNPERGLVEHKTTKLFEGATPVASFQQSHAYDGAGRITTLGYPQCVTGCSPTSQRNHGLRLGPTSSPSRVSPATSPTTPVECQAALPPPIRSPISTPRIRFISPAEVNPAKLSSTFLWGPQDYSYDPSGNITQIGSAKFAYDKISRLVSASIPGLTPVSYQEYTYDVFGNLTKVCKSTIEVAAGIRR